MADLGRTAWKIAITGSAGVGKTSLVEMIAPALALPSIDEEMRAYLERTRVRLSELPSPEVAAVLMDLWRKRQESETNHETFVADNCSLDFVAYALHYGCLTDKMASILLPEVLKMTACYDAVFVLPWGVLPYVADGVRSPHHHRQLGYQIIIEGLLRRYMEPARVHYLPEGINELSARSRWACSLLDRKRATAGERNGKGVVYLVGAGPGDPRLLTLRAYDLLQRADVVAHDLLVSPSIVSLVPGKAELLSVGRRYGAEKKPFRLHPDVLDRAHRGKTVVRLKCGDPLVFGRGGEEAEELAEAGIPFEIVPGISAALGAAAYSGIPLTHRLYSSQLTLSTGHEAGERLQAGDSANSSEDRGTTVLYMVTRRLQTNLARLVQCGYSPQTPAAYIAGATTSDQMVITGTLEDLAEKTRTVDAEVPAVVIAGRVVDLRKNIAWFENSQLQGCRILVARARPGVSAIARQLRSLGAEVVEAPNISVSPINGNSSFGAAIARLQDYDAVVFCCAAGVEHAWPAMTSTVSRNTQFIAIGEQARQALLKRGVHNVVSCSGSCDEALESIGTSLQGRRLLLVTSTDGRPGLLRQLAAIAASVDTVGAYKVDHSFAGLEMNGPFDLVVAPSSSAANLLLNSGWNLLRQVPFVTMGPLSSIAATEQRIGQVIQSPHDDIESLIGCVIAQLADRQRTMAATLAAEECS